MDHGAGICVIKREDVFVNHCAVACDEKVRRIPGGL